MLIFLHHTKGLVLQNIKEQGKETITTSYIAIGHSIQFFFHEMTWYITREEKFGGCLFRGCCDPGINLMNNCMVTNSIADSQINIALYDVRQSSTKQ